MATAGNYRLRSELRAGKYLLLMPVQGSGVQSSGFIFETLNLELGTPELYSFPLSFRLFREGRPDPNQNANGRNPLFLKS